MKKRINLCMCLLAIATCIVTFVATLTISYQTALARMETETMRQAALVAAGLEHIDALDSDEQKAYMQAIGKSDRSRVTLIEPDGTVIYDSNYDPSQMENHLERQEVQEATNNGTGEASRTSATLGQQTYYVAKLLDNGQILRVSNTTDLVTDDLQRAIAPLLLIIIVVIAFSIWLATYLTNRLVRPINTLKLDNPLENDIYEEISPLLHKIHTQNEELQKQMDKMSHQKVELEAITSNMSEGMVILDKELRILSVNQAAIRLLGAAFQDFAGQSLIALNRDQVLNRRASEAIKGRKTEHRMENQNDRQLQIFCNPVQVDNQVRGCVLLIVDISEKYAAEKSRREFTANVSHELKTPLTSISGYAEMISNGMAQPKDVAGFAEKIHTEAGRLLVLVDDIIKLSQLDEKAPMTVQFEKVDLKKLLESVSLQMKDYAEKKQVKIHVKAEDVIASGVPRMLEEAVQNLCSNAVKYNRIGGNVWLRVTKRDDMVYIEVEDDGIGIAKDDSEHIFERFYRADKSHSKTIEGTGLGLAIVRHIAELHGGSIGVQSEEGKGSVFTMSLPQNASTVDE